MPPVKPETQEQLPLDGDPIQNVEDPGTVAEIFQKNAEQLKQEAAATLEYAEDTPPAVEKDAEAELAAAPEVKPAKKVKKPKEKVVAAPEVEPETPPEAKVSRREAFKARAEEESTRRTKEDRLKEREAAVQSKMEQVETILRELKTDAYAYMEKEDPRFFEKLAERHIAGGKTPEKSETAALRAEINSLKEKIEGTQENTSKEIQMAKYERDLNEGERILSSPEFDAVRESAALFEKFTGQPTDFRRALAGVWVEYAQTYQKELTAGECCEILLEDAQAHIERVGKEFGKKEPPADPPLKKKTPPTGKTLTNAQETASAPAQEVDLSQFKSKADLLKHVAGTLEYEEEETVV